MLQIWLAFAENLINGMVDLHAEYDQMNSGVALLKDKKTILKTTFVDLVELILSEYQLRHEASTSIL